MKHYAVDDLAVGMTFDAPVYVDEDTLFVPENVAIREQDLKRLRSWNIETVMSDGGPKNADDRKNDFLHAVFTSDEYKKVLNFYAKLRDRLKTLYVQIQNHERVESSEIDEVVDGLIGELRERRDELIQYILYGLHGESGFEENAINAAVLSVLMGQSMGVAQHKIVELATAALLHDVGMLRLPESIVKKEGKLSGSELQQIKTHPVHSYKIITRELRYADTVGQAALQHQERWDGDGYPKGLVGERIVLPARIIAVADAFEAMVSKRPYRDSMIGYRAMRTILGDNGRRFDPEVLKVFIRTMGIYPLGSIVLLNNAAVGRVVVVNPQSPLRPSVKIMIDETGAELPNDSGDVIDLSKEKRLFIAQAVDPKEIGKDARPSE
ncbi:MAG: HD-GYP domain-containing protein [Spirochaetota bacterium]